MKIWQNVNFNKSPTQNLLLPTQSRAEITSPAEGQITTEGDVVFIYTSGAWHALDSGLLEEDTNGDLMPCE